MIDLIYVHQIHALMGVNVLLSIIRILASVLLDSRVKIANFAMHVYLILAIMVDNANHLGSRADLDALAHLVLLAAYVKKEILVIIMDHVVQMENVYQH